MSLLTKKRKPTELDLSKLNQEINFWTEIELDSNSPQIKRLLLMLDSTREDTIKEMETADIDKFNSEFDRIFFMASIRAKLQFIDSLKKKYLNAKSERDKWINERNSLTQE